MQLDQLEFYSISLASHTISICPTRLILGTATRVNYLNRSSLSKKKLWATRFSVAGYKGFPKWLGSFSDISSHCGYAHFNRDRTHDRCAIFLVCDYSLLFSRPRLLWTSPGLDHTVTPTATPTTPTAPNDCSAYQGTTRPG